MSAAVFRYPGGGQESAPVTQIIYTRQLIHFGPNTVSIGNRKNQALYEDEIDPTSKRLFSQLLFSYKLNARTVFYLGYSDNYRAYQDIDLTQSDRAVFLKIGYAWVL